MRADSRSQRRVSNTARVDITQFRSLISVAVREAQLLQKRRISKTVDFQGVRVRIDRPQGFVQRGRDEKGAEWERTYKTDYGYIPRTRGGDGDGLDVYLGPARTSELAYWISQRKGSGEFDEYKLMLGFPDRRSARSMWAAHTPERLYGGIATTSMGMVKALLGIEPMRVSKAIDAMVEADPPEAAAPTAVDMPSSVRTAIAKASSMRFAKADEKEQRYVLGIVLEPDVVDSQGDTYDAETIRKAAWLYMIEYRNVGLQHEQLINHAVKLVESYVAPVPLRIGDVDVAAGTWLAGYHVASDQIWEAVKRGDLTGLSIGGVATKIDPRTGEVIAPPPEEARAQL